MNGTRENSGVSEEKGAAEDESNNGGEEKRGSSDSLFFIIFFLIGFVPFVNISALCFLIKEIKIKGRDIKFGGCGLRKMYDTCLKGLFSGMLLSVLGIIFAVPGYIYKKLIDRKRS